MSSPTINNEEPSSSSVAMHDETSGSGEETASSQAQRPPAKRRLSNTVIEISDTDSDDSDVCAVTTYQATADEVKRIRGAEYSSSSSSTSSSGSEYSEDSCDSQIEDDEIVVGEYKRKHRPLIAELNTRASRLEDPKMSTTLKEQELIDSLKTHWELKKDFSNARVDLQCEPFRVCLLNNFLENPDIINNIVDDMNTLDWSRKKMDLYEFHQTADLANLTWQRSIRGIYELLKSEVMSWVSMVTGLALRSVSASCSLYGPGDHLLVHDDLLGDRRVAFILYLAPWAAPHPPRRHRPPENGAPDHLIQVDDEDGWAAWMGGALELLACDDSGPTKVTRKIVPKNNMLAFFTVNSQSFHQVGEVLSMEHPRLSINGWFHGPAPDAPAPAPGAPDAAPADAPMAEAPPVEPEPVPPHSQIVLLNEWIEPTYMTPRSRALVQQQMEAQSEVCLRDVLLPAVRARLEEGLASAEVPWEWVGPAHQRRYERVPSSWLRAEPAQPPHNQHIVRGVATVLSSTAFMRLLAECTDLHLTRHSRLELQRWTPAAFTLLPPREQYQQARLEALLYLGAPPRGRGGARTYVAPEDDSGALLSVPPADNALSLVYCDQGAAAFTKYLGRLAMGDHPHMYILTCTYYE